MGTNSFVDDNVNAFFYGGNVCPGCKQGLKIVYAQSEYCRCPNCLGYIEIKVKGNFKKISQAPKKIPPTLPIGAKGEINGISFEIIGYAACREAKSIYQWKEYYLYNRSHGFAYLSEYNGNWIYLTTPSPTPKVDFKVKSLVFDDKNFVLYNTYRTDILYSEGEFDFDIQYGPKAGIYEYIHPPYMLSCERNGTSAENWLQGEHIENSEIKRIFSIPTLPKKVGVGMVQPTGNGYTMRTLWSTVLFGIAFLFTIHLALYSIKDSSVVVFDKTYSLPDTGAVVPPIVTPPFVIGKGLMETDNLAFFLEAPIQNTWVEAQINLINENTGTEYTLETGAEYYFGSDWTEGSKESNSTLSEIPAGTYHMNIFPAKEQNTHVPYFRLAITRGEEMWSNLFIIIGIMLIFPCFKYYRHRSIEQQRWAQSDFGQ